MDAVLVHEGENTLGSVVGAGIQQQDFTRRSHYENTVAESHVNDEESGLSGLFVLCDLCSSLVGEGSCENPEDQHGPYEFESPLSHCPRGLSPSYGERTGQPGKAELKKVNSLSPIVSRTWRRLCDFTFDRK